MSQLNFEAAKELSPGPRLIRIPSWVGLAERNVLRVADIADIQTQLPRKGPQLQLKHCAYVDQCVAIYSFGVYVCTINICFA